MLTHKTSQDNISYMAILKRISKKRHVRSINFNDFDAKKLNRLATKYDISEANVIRQLIRYAFEDEFGDKKKSLNDWRNENSDNASDQGSESSAENDGGTV